jgi:hypothetical protein
MQDFYVTFGVQYGHGKNQELHPVFDWIDSNGYVRVSAVDYENARAFVDWVLGDKWAFMYYEQPIERYATLGELAHWEATEESELL